MHVTSSLQASQALSALLARAGASALAPDVAALGDRLLRICSVHEAVHEPLYCSFVPYVQRVVSEHATSAAAAAAASSQAEGDLEPF